MIRYTVVKVIIEGKLAHVVLKSPYETMKNIIMTVPIDYVWKTQDKRRNRGFRTTLELKPNEVVKLPLF